MVQIFLIPMVAMLAACSEMATEVAEVDIPRISPMLNVVSFIAPGEPVRVDVFEVVPMAYNRPLSGALPMTFAWATLA